MNSRLNVKPFDGNAQKLEKKGLKGLTDRKRVYL